MPAKEIAANLILEIELGNKSAREELIRDWTFILEMDEKIRNNVDPLLRSSLEEIEQWEKLHKNFEDKLLLYASDIIEDVCKSAERLEV